MNDEGEEDLELVAKMDELYSKLGISVYDANGELKNTFGLLEALAEVYPTLTNAEKAYVTETIAGKYQAQNAAAILNNFQTAIGATATAFDSAGSAASENEKVLDSIQGKISAFKSAFEELSSSLISSGFIKMGLSIGTALINMIGAFDGYAIKMAGFITVMMGVSKGYHTLYNAINLLGNGIDKNTASIIKNTLASANLSNQTRVGVMQILSEKGAIDLNSKSLTAETKEKILNTLATTNLTKAQKEAILATIEQNVANTTLTASTSTLKTALRGLWGVMKAHPIMLVLSIAATAFSAITSMINDARQKEIEAVQEAISEASELDNTFSELNNTITQIQNLRATLDDSTSSYTDAVAAREELYEIQKDLISNYGLEADEIDLVNGSLDEQIERIKELRKETAQDWLNSNRTEIKDAEEQVYGDNPFQRKRLCRRRLPLHC